MLTLRIEAHPALDAGAFVTEFPVALGSLPPPAEVATLLSADAAAPFASDDAVRKAVRDLLRHGGYKPTGRGKPSSEYLLAAVPEGKLPAINAAVDACNAVSYHSGLPISVVDLDRAAEPCSIATPAEGASYVFNASGQVIDIGGLLSLFDAAGPCANAVKDAHRTKTHAETRRTLSVVWGTLALADRTARVVAWYRAVLERAGARTRSVELRIE